MSERNPDYLVENIEPLIKPENQFNISYNDEGTPVLVITKKDGSTHSFTAFPGVKILNQNVFNAIYNPNTGHFDIDTAEIDDRSSELLKRCLVSFPIFDKYQGLKFYFLINF